MKADASIVTKPLILLLLGGALLLALVIGVGGRLYFEQQKKHVHNSADQMLSSIADLKSSQIERWMQERFSDAEVLFNQPEAWSILPESDGSTQSKSLRKWLNNLTGAYRYDAVMLFDRAGSLRLAIPADSPHQNTFTPELVRKALAEKAIVFNDLDPSALEKPLHMNLMVPLGVAPGADLPAYGVLALVIDPELDLYPMVRQWPVPTKTAETLFFRRDGKEVMYLSERRHRGDAQVTPGIGRTRFGQSLLVDGSGSLTGVEEAVDYRDIPVLAATRKIEGTPWFITAKVDREEVFAELYREQRIIAAAAAFLFFSLLAGVGFSWRQQQVSLLRRTLQDRERSEALLRESEERYRLVVEGVKDYAIIMLDAEGRVVSWSDGAERLKGYGKEEILGRHFSCFYSEEDIRDLLPARSLDEAMEKGRIELQGWRLRKDGSRFWANTIITPVVDDKGGLRGFAKVTRDITELWRTQQLLERRLELSSQAARVTVPELLQRTIDMAEEMTDSSIGFFHFFSETMQEIILQQWSTRTKREFCRAEGYGMHYGLAMAGVWSDAVKECRAVIHNDYPSLQHRKGLPEGHAAVTRELVVPILRDDKVVAILGVGNKSSDYLPEDVEMVNLFAHLAWDVAERKVAEEALRASERELSATFEQASVGIAHVGMDGRWLRVNGKLCAILGYSKEEFLQRGLADISLPEDLAADLDGLKALLAGGIETYVTEKQCHRRDRSQVWILLTVSLVRRPSGEPEYYIAIIEDIHARKVAEAALQEETAFSRQLLDAPEDTVFVFDPYAGRAQRWNDAFRRISGYSDQEIEGMGAPEAYYDPAELPLIASALQRLIVDGRATAELHLRTKDGRRLPYEYGVSGLLDGEGNLRHVIVIGRDIAERKRAEEELGRLNEDLRRSNRELEQFAYVASHDLQEPLRMVASYTQLLAQRYHDQLDDKAKKFIDYAVDGATRMQTLINDLLLYSRVSTRGKSPESVDIRTVFDCVQKNLAAAIADSGASLTSGALPVVMGDPSQLEMLFQNLIHNGIKFCGEGRPSVHISAEDRGGEWLFSVRDNGIGIDARYADKVFVIFQRLHTREEYPGTGIGLAVCKRIVERHGGRIWFASEPGEGTTFHFTLTKFTTGKENGRS